MQTTPRLSVIRRLAGVLVGPETPGALSGFLAIWMTLFPDLITGLRWLLLGVASVLVAWTVLAAYLKDKADERERAETARERLLSLSNAAHKLTHAISPLLEELRKCQHGVSEHLTPTERADALRKCVEEVEDAYRKRYKRGAERVLARFRQRRLRPAKTTRESRARANIDDIRDVYADLNILADRVDKEYYRWGDDDD